MTQITSRRNPIVARFRGIARRTTPDDRFTLLEGPRLIDEALAAGVTIDVAAVAGAADSSRWATLIERLDRTTRIIHVTPPVMEAISPVSTPSGVIAIARMPAQRFDSAIQPDHPLILGLIGVQDPGNTGAVIRAAEAGGATGVVTIGGADPFGWKAVRGSMGSVLRLPVSRADNPLVVSATAKTHGLRLLAAAPRGGISAPDADLSRPALIWLGAEGSGLGAGVIDTADEVISIPMCAPVESLNIAVAAALLVYEAGRQRRRVSPAAGSSDTAGEVRSA